LLPEHADKTELVGKSVEFGVREIDRLEGGEFDMLRSESDGVLLPTAAIDPELWPEKQIPSFLFLGTQHANSDQQKTT